MISQRDSVFRQFLLRLVQKRNVGFHHIRGRPMRCRYDQIVAPDRLVVSDGRVDLPGHKLIDPRVRSRADQTEPVKPPLDLLGGMAEKARELHIAVAEFRHLAERLPQILLRNVPDTEHLNSVFHMNCFRPFLAYARL